MKIQYLMFSGGVSQDSANKLVSKASELARSKHCDEIQLLLNSGGGNIRPGIYCYTMLRALPVNLTTHNVGVVESIANVIYLAGERRYAAPTASFMFHDFHWSFNQSETLSVSQLEEKVASLMFDRKRVKDIYADRIGTAFIQKVELFPVKEFKVSAEWATKNGLAHEIRPAEIPKNAPLHHVAC